jgi:hypothetical protein
MECIGDGRVNYRPEKVLEALYAARLEKWLVLTFDYQFFVDPAHSADEDRFRSSQRAFMRSSEGLTQCPVGVLCHEHRRSKRHAQLYERWRRALRVRRSGTDPKPPQAAVVKSNGGERCGNVGTMIPAGTVERGERKRTAAEASKSD